jgi:hypothetical protein
MSQRQVETGRAMRAHASKDSKTQKKVPKRFVKPTGEDAIAGRYEAGIKNDKFTLLFGQTVATWVHVEDQMIQVLQDLLGSKSAPARQIFHSVVSNKARQSLMLACLQKSKINLRNPTCMKRSSHNSPSLTRNAIGLCTDFGTPTKQGASFYRKVRSMISITWMCAK